MSGIVTFTGLCQALSDTGIPFAAFAWDSDPIEAGYPAYGVVDVDGGIQLTGDDTHAEDGVSGSIDLFTTRLSAEDFNAVSAVLKGLEIPYRLESVQYEQDRRLLHYEWLWDSPGAFVTE